VTLFTWAMSAVRQGALHETFNGRVGGNFR